MTRGQESLVIEASGGASPLRGAPGDGDAADLGAHVLPLLAPSDEERRAHEALLRELDAACKSGAVWRPAEAVPAVA
jgi:DNA polymerase-3 subunit epsilon